MDKILHDPKDPKWELWYIPYMGHAGFWPSAVWPFNGAFMVFNGGYLGYSRG